MLNDNFKMRKVLFLLLSARLFSSCGTVKKELPELYWPLPPLTPKIKFVNVYATDKDVKKTSAFLEFLAGEEAVGVFKPHGVASDKDGRIYVTDTVLRKVFIFDTVGSKFKSIGDDPRAKLQTPAGIAINDRDGIIYVSDTGLDKVIAVLYFGSVPAMENPSGLAVDLERNRLYIVETKGHRLRVFDLSGKELFAIGSRGPVPGMFNFPMDVAIDSKGNIYVLDSGNFRVQVFTPDEQFIRSFGSIGSYPGQFSRPRGIAIDSDDNVYVTDAAFSNFQIFNNEGELLMFVGGFGYDLGKFDLPADIFIDKRDYIYIVDQLNRRVQVFQYLKE